MHYRKMVMVFSSQGTGVRRICLVKLASFLRCLRSWQTPYGILPRRLRLPKCNPFSVRHQTTSVRGLLGTPLPLHEHAVSVSMPLWQHVVGYEEGDQSVHSKLACGYPRFVYHPYVRQLAEVWLNRVMNRESRSFMAALPFPNRGAALRCQRFIQQSQGFDPSWPVSVHDMDSHGVFMVSFPNQLAGEAKAYWQHSGEILSSRKAQAVLRDLGHTTQDITQGFPSAPRDYHLRPPEPQVANCYRAALQSRIGTLTGQSPDDVFLTVSGMAAIFTAFRICKKAFPKRKAVIFGFPYLDTLKICLRSQWSHGVHFLGRGDAADMAKLEEILKHEEIMGIFTEFPSNPLLQCHDIGRLCELGRRYGFPVVADDTIGGFHNVDLLRGGEGVSIVVTSLTKLFSGVGDVMAGSLVMNQGHQLYGRLAEAADLIHEGCPSIFDADAQAVFHNALDYETRSSMINSGAQALADWLVAQPGVRCIYYPKFTQPNIYQSFLRHGVNGVGYGGLLSIVLDEQAVSPMTFYDSLDVCKGPSLGTNFTLVCPYTLLAHYHELDFAQTYGVAPNLVRVSVGLEPAYHLKYVFEQALLAAKEQVVKARLFTNS